MTITPIAVMPFDFVKQEKIGKAVAFDVLEDARIHAKAVASKWCQDEEPVIYGTHLKGSIEMCRGYSDFGALIIKNKELLK